jgi:hypothetical protein
MDQSSPPSDQGKMWAILSYVGLIFFLPLGAIPMIMRDDSYALYHGKNATAVWLGALISSIVLSIVITVLSAVTCGVGAILFPLALLPGLWLLVTGIHGLILTLNAKWQEPMGVFGLGDRLFANVKPKDAITGP